MKDANRDALFSGARDRYKQQDASTNNAPASNSGSGAAAGDSKYGGYGSQRELTEVTIL